MYNDIDPNETNDWIDSIQDVINNDGRERALFLLAKINEQLGKTATYPGVTPYSNTFKPDEQSEYPGCKETEKKIRALIRWNAVMIVLRASRKNLELGGHIGTFASAAHLYDVGFNHFFRAANDKQSGDMIFIQGHSSPGIYARSFLEGRLTAEQLDGFRQEVNSGGISSYPHPWLMPEYWQFPTVSMGLGPMQAIYTARYNKYLVARGLVAPNDQKVWCFCGDGEMDEPESLGAITVASREKLDNLIFVVNCNLQRLDGPVRGNGKIIQELEGLFKGAGWNVLKVVWGSEWDDLIEDDDGLLQKVMEETVDGEFQNHVTKGGAYIREKFFGVNDELAKRVADLSDDELHAMRRGGHDSEKIYTAYAAAMQSDKPTIILAKTVKGFGLGGAGEGLNTAHNTKKMALDQIKDFRDRFSIPISDDQLEDLPFYKPDDNSDLAKYIQSRRKDLQGFLPARRTKATKSLTTPTFEAFANFYEGSTRSISTTMAFVRLLTQLCKDKKIGPNLVPIVPDEARTFGMEGLFRQLGIYAHSGQLYEPVDKEQVMFYKESKNGQILEEGINEGGAFSSWMAAATSYSTHDVITVPFYIYYSMFGFQRIGDYAWAAGDSRARGFLIGATAGRTTLNGEGLQHEDGHSHIFANTIPNCISYDPTYNFELAVIIQDGLHRMATLQEDVFYYITVMNENYEHPKMPEGAAQGIKDGMYLLEEHKGKSGEVVLLGSGTILNEVRKAATILCDEYDLNVKVYSVTSFNLMTRDVQAKNRAKLLNVESKEISHVAKLLNGINGPVVAASDYMKIYAEGIRPDIPTNYITLGTDGFGRSDSRENLREFFEVNSKYVALAALTGLLQEGQTSIDVVHGFMKKNNLSADKLDPMYC